MATLLAPDVNGAISAHDAKEMIKGRQFIDGELDPDKERLELEFAGGRLTILGKGITVSPSLHKSFGHRPVVRHVREHYGQSNWFRIVFGTTKHLEVRSSTPPVFKWHPEEVDG